ncbi:MAG: PIN domain-containing protein [Parcubacteria group bacterium]|nr:PIN domain-containing protein [Parcubacteria group bacterium]
MNVFLDANIFFAAARSPHGGSSFVLELAKAGSITLMTVEYALFEAERAIHKKLSIEHVWRHYQNLQQCNLIVQPIPAIEPPVAALLERIVPVKDIPILIGAIHAHVDVLVTLDRQHFLGNTLLRRFHLPFEIMNPREFLTKYF